VEKSLSKFKSKVPTLVHAKRHSLFPSRSEMAFFVIDLSISEFVADWKKLPSPVV